MELKLKENEAKIHKLESIEKNSKYKPKCMRLFLCWSKKSNAYTDLYTPTNKVWWYIGINMSVRLFVRLFVSAQ